MTDETMVGTTWCLENCPYRTDENCKFYDTLMDCYADNNRKYWKEG